MNNYRVRKAKRLLFHDSFYRHILTWVKTGVRTSINGVACCAWKSFSTRGFTAEQQPQPTLVSINRNSLVLSVWGCDCATAHCECACVCVCVRIFPRHRCPLQWQFVAPCCVKWECPGCYRGPFIRLTQEQIWLLGEKKKQNLWGGDARTSEEKKNPHTTAQARMTTF